MKETTYTCDLCHQAVGDTAFMTELSGRDGLVSVHLHDACLKAMLRGAYGPTVSGSVLEPATP